MPRIPVEFTVGGQLHDAPHVHDGHPVTDMLNNASIMRDENTGEPHFFLNLDEEIDHLGLYGNIQCRDRLVADDQPWIQCQGSRDAYPLSLASSEIMRVYGCLFRRESDFHGFSWV
jgi:hypothetical protein